MRPVCARAEILGAGPLRLSVVHPDDALPVDNHLWLVNPSETQMNVAMVRCQGDAPLFDQLLNVDGLRFQNFGDITSWLRSQQRAIPLITETDWFG